MATKLKGLEVSKVDFVDEGANPDADIKLFKSKGSVLKKLFGFIGKAAGLNQHEIESALDEIQKGDSVSFGEVFNERKNRQIADEIWDVCYALQSSLCSILNDAELDSTGMAEAMKESLGEFQKVISESIENWSGGKTIGIVKMNEDVSDYELETAKSAVNKLNRLIEKSISEPVGSGPNEKKLEGEKEMKIDKSKLSDAERAFLEDIEKRCGTEDRADVADGTDGAAGSRAQEEPMAKSVSPVIEEPAVQDNADDEIYKGLHPAVKAELEELKKFKDAAEERELGQIADKYAIIGKKKEELVPLFKSLRAAGGTAYDDMIAVLDQTVDVVEKSGAFGEIGKSGHGSAGVNETEQKIGTIAKGYMEKDASLDYTSAVAKAWNDNPELFEQYDEEYGSR